MSAPAESPIVIESREELIAILCEASELEHMIMCQYLFAAFSLKRSVAEGLSEEQLAAVTRWNSVVLEVAAQEMLHWALVSNLLESIGAAPHFSRPNFPQQAKYYPPGISMALLPFGEHALEHFIFLERPEGMEGEDAPEFATVGPADINVAGAQLVPVVEDYTTVGQLYHGIENGIKRLVAKYGEERVFIGQPKQQATGDDFRWPDLIAITDLASAVAAIEVIVEQGEGARGSWENSHYGKFVGIMQEYKALRAQYPDFEPARPVVAARVRPAMDVSADLPLITEPLPQRVADLFNACYEALLQTLIRYFVSSDETVAELSVLADTAVSAMFMLIEPLGRLLTTLPVGVNAPGKVAGATFEMFRTSYILPHRGSAWIVLHERLLELADYAAALTTDAQVAAPLKRVESNLRKLAAKLEPHISAAETPA